jgi:delta24-sterol reductase
MGLLQWLIVHHRWFICLFLLPLSVLFDVYVNARAVLTRFIARFWTAARDARVRGVQNQVKAWATGSKEKPMVTARPGWQTMSIRIGKYKRTHAAIDLGALCNVIGVNKERNSVSVEPLVTIGQLSRYLDSEELMLAVVPELDDLTIGGMIAGCGVESSSHKYGLFQHTCTSMDIILADGSLVHCSESEHTDLYHAFPWSHGTLGFLASVDLRVVPRKPWLRLEYFSVSDRDQACKMLQEEAAKGQEPETKGCADFIEGLAFSPSEYVIMLGYFATSPDVSRINRIGRWYKPWFYRYVRGLAAKNGRNGQVGTDFIPLRDYYHRHTRSLFWELQDIIPFGNNPLFRLLLGWAMPPKPSLLKMTQTEEIVALYEKFHVVQDMLVPISTLSRSLSVMDANYLVYPLWLCPTALPNAGAGRGGIVESRTRSKDCMYIDIGAYGVPGNPKAYEAEKCGRAVEEYVRKVGGFQLLYADTYMTREEFESMFDHTLYRQVRSKYPDGTRAFPEIYDKVSRAARK